MQFVKSSNLLKVLIVACSLACFAPSSGFAQSSYTWAVSCSGAAVGGGAGTGVSWNWLHNGVQISYTSPPNGFASCATPPLTGGGEIPASINGIQVNGIEVDVSVSEYPAGCDAFASVKKSFDPSSPQISITESVKEPSTVDSSGRRESCPKAGFSFSISN